ncbi:MAG: C1 family peptidase [Bacteroidales bacterium]|nr:C1 family peptidase [Bacteroidales bacterium]
MKKVFLVAALGLLSVGAFAQKSDPKGGLTPEMLAEISKGYAGTPSDKAIRNALNTTQINVLATNAENLAMIDTHFSDEVKTWGRTDQASSGRCWLFTGLNVLRAKMIDKFDLGPFTFSQNYVFFYDQLEKANLFLQGIIDTKDLPFEDRQVDWLFANPISDGGQFTGVSNLIMKYGVVPSEVMPETLAANNTSQMRTQIANKLREDGLLLRDAWEKASAADKRSGKAASRLQEMKIDYLKEVYHMLAICLGVPPTEFTWTRRDRSGEVRSTKTYTPKSFYEEYIGEDLENNYIMVMNDPVREYYKVYEIQYDRHVYDGENWVYLNLPIEDIKQMAIASIKDNTAMYFSCDVNKFLSRTSGVADLRNYDYESLMGVTFGMNKEQRVKTHASGSTHAMTLIAVDLKDGKPTKWMVENSWGASSGYKGNIIMTDEWFNEYMFRLVLQKKYVPDSIMKYFDQEPIQLPSWDPMFLPEE